MSSSERRNSIALDDAYYYCRQLETAAVAADLFTLCNAIRTVDLALSAPDETLMRVSLCREAWSRVRDSLFNALVSSFSGYFELFETDSVLPIVPGGDWPQTGTVDFYPQTESRKHDSYTARLDSLRPETLNPLRWAFAEGRQQVSADEFLHEPEPIAAADEEDRQRTGEFLDRLYLICEQEAAEGKKKAHRKWWQLYWQADSCDQKKEKHELQKQMLALQSIWGRPTSEYSNLVVEDGGKNRNSRHKARESR